MSTYEPHPGYKNVYGAHCCRHCGAPPQDHHGHSGACPQGVPLPAPADQPTRSESCPLCGEDVIPAEVRLGSGVPWTRVHHAHALCALENVSARVTELERALERIAGPRWWER